MPNPQRLTLLNRPLELEAHNPKRNVHRFYRIWTQGDLFNIRLVCTQYGRIGRRGHIKEYEVSNEEEAHRLVMKILTKRMNAAARIGVAYKVG